jgi:N-acyl-L-homoserine lactone synthetase
MIHYIEHHAATAQRHLLDGMFEDRRRLFVDLFGWDIPVIDGRFEIDQFDTADTVYIVAADDRGDHAASLRLMPSTRPHMLAAIFPQLCPGGVPIGPTIWESTRLCLPQRHGAALRKGYRNQLISAMVDFALERGIDRLTGVLPDPFRREVLAMGWVAEALGPPVRIGGGPIGAFAAHVGPDTPCRLRWTGVYVGKGQGAVA